MPSAVTTNLTPIQTPSSPHTTVRRASLKALSRNIGKVALGNLLFDTWYYSPYPDSIILGSDHQHASTAKHIDDGKDEFSRQHNSSTSNNGVLKADHTPLCSVLHICPYCFRYTPSHKDYTGHLNLHIEAELEQGLRSAKNLPSHDDESHEFLPVPSTATKVYSWEGYSVWDVDGEVEKLYCQNLSLFGKLFLEQKSVFFDTAGFHYFILTYTPPPSPKTTKTTPTQMMSKPRGRRRRTSSQTSSSSKPGQIEDDARTHPQLRAQVLGFFSKENLSWDSNNLACILVFPPYQHRNLGQLLMAVSYKLSGWEWEDSIIGGPEKPLSSMGRKSYLRFWSERIARFIMGQTWDADGKVVFEHNHDEVMENENKASAGGSSSSKGNGILVGQRKRKKASGSTGYKKEEMTVREIGERTGMLSEDVVAALNEMGVCEAVVPKRKKKRSSEEGRGGTDHASTSNNNSNTTNIDGSGGGVSTSNDDILLSMTISRDSVLRWVRDRGVDLVSPVKEEGFLGEWALSDVASAGSDSSQQRQDKDDDDDNDENEDEDAG